MSAPPAQQGQQQQVANWLTEAQVRRQPVGSIPYDGGQGVVRNLYMPQAGYLGHNQLVTKVAMTAGLSTAPANPDPNAYAQGPLQEIKVFVNSEGTLYDLDGFMAACVGALDTLYERGSAKFYPYPQNSFTPYPGTNVFANRWMHRIPLSIQLRNMATPIGLYNTALQNLTITQQIRFLPILGATTLPPGSSLYQGSGTTPSTNYTGSVDINEEYFEPIPIAQAQPPLAYIHRWTQFSIPISTATGYTDVPLPGRSQYLRMLYAVYDAAAAPLVPSPNILTQLQLIYGVQNAPYDETIDQVYTRMRRSYGGLMDTWPSHVYTHDFVNDTHTARDWFDGGAVTNLRARLWFSGAHPATSTIVCATEEVLSLRDAGPSYGALQMAA